MDLLLPDGVDAMHVDGACLDDIKAAGRIAFVKKIAAFGDRLDHGEFSDGAQFDRRYTGEELAIPGQRWNLDQRRGHRTTDDFKELRRR